eukprot:746229-Hanusia_phi.AAC.12
MAVGPGWDGRAAFAEFKVGAFRAARAPPRLQRARSGRSTRARQPSMRTQGCRAAMTLQVGGPVSCCAVATGNDGEGGARAGTALEPGGEKLPGPLLSARNIIGLVA